MKLILIMMVFLLSLSGCTAKPNNICNEQHPRATKYNAAHYPVVIKNYESNNRPVDKVFNRKPQRVVVHHQNIIEAMIALGEEDKIVAAGYAGTDNKLYSPQYAEKVKKIPVVGDWNIDFESVLYSQPDLIIGWKSSFNDKLLRTTYFWKNRGVNTYIAANSNNILAQGSIEEECRFIDDLGKIFDKQEVTDKLIQEIRDELATVKEKIKGRKQSKVLILEMLGRRIVNYDKTRLAGNMVTQLGGELMECPSHSLSEEQLLMMNPDVIFVVCATGQNKAFFVDKLYREPIYKSINAVKNKRVYPVPLIYLYVSGTRTIDGIRTFKKGLYPDLE